ncbi:PAS domain S-box protein [Flavobacterium ponti]|uniref:histidine kinase n=1 Tax=Flavobacterium ponti TaxID=665133 RepID=A0ABV9P7G7_9FLAO
MNITKNFYRIINWFFDRPKFFGSIVFTTLSFLFIYIAFQNYKISKEDKKTEMTNTLNVISKNIEQLLKNSYTTTLTLALTINDEGIPQDFDLIAKQLLESNNSISAVELVPNGVIKYIYPLEENKAALNLDILNAELFKKEALKSIKTKKIYFAGPFELTQGGQGIVGRLPIFVKNKFWGFSAVVISLDKLLKTSGIQSIKKENFYFQLSKVNPNTGKEVFYLPESIKPKKNNYVKRYIPDGDWNLYIIDKDSNALLKLFLIKILIAILVAFTIGYFMFMLLEKPKELKYLIQSQAKKLIKTELKFKAIFDQAAIGIVNVDAETKKIIDVNERFCNLLGYTVDEMREMNFQEITHTDDIERSLKNVESIKKGITDEYTFEKRYLSKEGKIIWANLTITRFEKNDNSEATTLIALIQDITELKKNKGLIINSQQRIESLINTIDGIVWECDARTFEFSFISKKVENILGYTAEEWLSSKTFWQDHIYIEDREKTLNYCLDKTSYNLNHDFEYRMVAKDGRLVWLSDIVNVVSDNNKPVSLRGIMIDVTKKKEIEKNLNHSFDLLSQQNERLLNFSYIVSHNLRSHTSNISSLIELIETAEKEDEKKQLLDLLKSVSNSLNETMTNLNEVVNIQTNISLTIEKVNLYNYVSATLKLLSNQIELHDVLVDNQISNDEEINYNPAYLESILFNIISNAIRYCHKERKSIITLRCYREKEFKIIEIADNGIGIDLKKYENKIFGMYKTFSGLADSRGIGLFITKNQVDAMGGNIIVESEPNVGTTFKIFVL